MQATKRPRPSSNDSDPQTSQRPRTHNQSYNCEEAQAGLDTVGHAPDQTPAHTPGHTPGQTWGQQQEQNQAPQVLHLCDTNVCITLLTDHASSRTMLQTWLDEEESKTPVCSAYHPLGMLRIQISMLA